MCGNVIASKGLPSIQSTQGAKTHMQYLTSRFGQVNFRNYWVLTSDLRPLMMYIHELYTRANNNGKFSLPVLREIYVGYN